MGFAISAGHEETLATAKLILENGGNAFDAAIASAFSMFITEPCMASAGAGGFAMIRKAGEEVRMLDFFTQTPIQKRTLEHRDFYPIKVDFGNEEEEFHVGMASIATPGMISGLFELHRNYASMPMSDLLNPAKELAKTGVVINAFQALDLSLLSVIIREDTSVKDIFFNEDGSSLAIGDKLHMPHLPSFLDMIEHEGEQEIYKGEISRIIDQDSRERGGYIRREDLENYRSIWRSSIKINAFEHNVYLPNGPSLGGALMALVLDAYREKGNWIEAVIEIRQAYESITNIQSGMNSRLPHLGYDALDGTASTKGTSHFNIIDDQNNTISFSTSLGEGCGYFVPGTNMQMNNMMGESFLLPDGFHSWIENTRLHSMMTPTLVYDKQDQFKYAGGSGGAGRIPYMIAQVLGQSLEFDMPLKEATEFPRSYLMHETMHLEEGLSTILVPDEIPTKIWTEASLFFGGVHSIANHHRSGIESYGDPRRFGVHYTSK